MLRFKKSRLADMYWLLFVNPCILKEDVRMPEVTWLSWIRPNNSRSPRVSVLSKAIYCKQGRALPSSATMPCMTAASMVVLKKNTGLRKRWRRSGWGGRGRKEGVGEGGVVTPTLKRKPAWGQAGFTKGQDVVDLYRNHTEEMSVNFLSFWHPCVCACLSVCVFLLNPPPPVPSLGLLHSQRLTVAPLPICTNRHGNSYTSILRLLFRAITEEM